jgi:hypothetical protein
VRTVSPPPSQRYTRADTHTDTTPTPTHMRHTDTSDPTAGRGSGSILWVNPSEPSVAPVAAVNIPFSVSVAAVNNPFMDCSVCCLALLLLSSSCVFWVPPFVSLSASAAFVL